jgi:subtilase family serine protease
MAPDLQIESLADGFGPNYRRFLTPEQFATQFGPTEADYQAAILTSGGSIFCSIKTETQK